MLSPVGPRLQARRSPDPALSFGTTARGNRLRRARLLPARDPLEHANRQDHRLQPRELQPALDRERRLVVQEAVVEAVVLEHELAEEEDRARVILAHALAEPDDLLDGLGADVVAVVRGEAEPPREGDVLLEVLLGLLLQRFDLRRTL